MRFGRVQALHSFDGGRVIESDTAFTSGASGGGLFDATGKLVGLLTFRSKARGGSYYSLPVGWIRDRLPRAGDWAEVGPLPDGYASELGLAARAWVRSVADWLDRGLVLLIDYGFPRREYYHPQRLMGTIMCHYRHHSHADALWLPGLNDVTAHVDFTAMADAAAGAGLQIMGYTTQAHFLLNCSLVERLTDTPLPAESSAVQRLISEAEMGELFKVLALGRGIVQPLLGFARGDRTARL